MAVDAKRRAEQVSGVSNVAFDLMAVLTNKLEGIAAIEEYKQDCEQAGDREARETYERIEQRDQEDVRQLKNLVVQRLR
jgi:hypothetical protein